MQTDQRDTKPTKNVLRLLDIAAIGLMTLTWYYAAKHMFMSDLNPNGDNYYYLHLMQNMWEGNGYGTSNSGVFKPTNWFPPGYPLILLVERWLLGDNIVSFKWVNLLFYLGTVLLTWDWLKNWLDNRALPLVIALMILMNGGLWHFGVQLMSEIPFMFFGILALRSMHLLEERTEFWKSPHFYLALVSIGFAYHIRGIGVVLPAAIVLHQLLRKQWKLAGTILVAFMLMATPWMVRNSQHGLEGRYLETVTKKNAWNPEEGAVTTMDDWTKKLKKNTYDTLVRGALEVTIPHLYPTEQERWVWVLGSIFLLLILFGLFVLGPTGRLLILFLAGNGAVFLMWHGGNLSRYVWPLTPILYLGLFNGVLFCVRWVSNRLNVRYASSFAFILLALGFLTRPRLDQFHTVSQNPMNNGFKTYLGFADSVKFDNLKNPMIVCRKPLIFHKHSGARTSRFPYTTDSLKMLQYLVKTDPDYIVLDNMGYNSSSKFLVPFLNKNKDIWYLDTKDNEVNMYLLRYRKEAGESKLAEWNALSAHRTD